MHNIHHYSREKFTSFTAEKQTKAILELLQALENNLTQPETCSRLISHLLECLSWTDKAANPAFSMLAEIVNEEYTPVLLLNLIAPILDAYQLNPRDDEILIRRFDTGVRQAEAAFPLTVILDNLRSAYNVGAILRTAECFGVRKVYHCGITPFTEHPKVQKTAMGTDEHLDCEYLPATREAVKRAKQDGLTVLALETSLQSVSLEEIKPTCSVALILGNEALGIDEQVLKLADAVVNIPLYGRKNSLNVSSAFAIACHWLSGRA